jgi:2-polyprenyl-3-methyl-5-hydroxy-6-metoxy-1,4-benzoquinol methylase
MATATESKQPSPELFFQTMNAYQRTAALKAAVELDLFTKISEGANTVAPLAQKCQASERGIRILSDYLVIAGFLTKDGSSYGLTIDSATFLDRRSPAYIASAVKFLGDPNLTDHFKDLAAVVRRGGPAAGSGTLAPDNAIWVEFARAMGSLQTMPSVVLAKFLGAESRKGWKVLDIAASHGLFGIAIAKLDPGATIFAVDWGNVLTVAKENAQAAGVTDRYNTIPGSAFDVEFGSGYNVALLTNFLHHFDAATNEQLLRKIHAALAPGGRAVTLEFIPNDDRVSPPLAASFSLTMLGSTAGGDAYTYSEFERMHRNAGFSSCEMHPLPPTFSQVVVAQK